MVFLVPITFMIHNFWKVTDATAVQTQQIHFGKNFSMLVATRLIMHLGSEPLGLDNKG